MKNLFFLILILSFNAYSQDDYEKDTLTCPVFDTTLNESFNLLNTNELISKIESKNPIEILSSFYYLIKNDHEFDLAQTYLKVMENESRIKYKLLTSGRDEGMIVEFAEDPVFYKFKPFQVNVFVYLMYKNFKGQLFPNKGHNTREELITLDSLIIHHSSKNYLKVHALYDDLLPYTEKYKSSLKSIISDRNKYSFTRLTKALTKIAKFKNTDDIEYILSFDKKPNVISEQTLVVMRAIQEFPNAKFKPYIEQKVKLLKTTEEPKYYYNYREFISVIQNLALLFREPQFFNEEVINDLLQAEFDNDEHKQVFFNQFALSTMESYSSDQYPLLNKIILQEQIQFQGNSQPFRQLNCICSFKKHPDYLKLKEDIRIAILNETIEEKYYPMEFFVEIEDEQFDYFHDYLCAPYNSINNENLKKNHFDVRKDYIKKKLIGHTLYPNKYFNWSYDSILLYELLNKKLYYESLSFQKLFENEVYNQESKVIMEKILNDTSYSVPFDKDIFLTDITLTMNVVKDTASKYFDLFMKSDIQGAIDHVMTLLPCLICEYDKDYTYFYYYLDQVKSCTDEGILRVYLYKLQQYYICMTFNQGYFYKDLFKKVKKVYKQKYKEGVISKFDYEKGYLRDLEWDFEVAKERETIIKNFEE